MIAMWCIFDKFIFLTLHFFKFCSSFISVTNYISAFKNYRVNSWSSVCPHGIHFSWVLVLFQFCEDFVRTHPACQQPLQHCFGSSLLSFFSSLRICLCLLRFQHCHFFFGLLQSSLLLFQISLQSVNVCGDGCDLSSQGSDRYHRTLIQAPPPVSYPEITSPSSQ